MQSDPVPHLVYQNPREMKLFSFICAGSFLLASAFIIKNENGARQSLYEEKWSLKKIYTDTGAIAVNSRAYIRFHEEKKSAGGNGGCNVFGSTIAVNGHSLVFSEIIATRMYCEGVQESEDAYLNLLAKVKRFDISEKKLWLLDGKKVLLEFETE